MIQPWGATSFREGLRMGAECFQALKKVLSNVKTRGTWGEVQLGTMLEQVLNPEQFATNVATKDGASTITSASSIDGPLATSSSWPTSAARVAGASSVILLLKPRP